MRLTVLTFVTLYLSLGNAAAQNWRDSLTHLNRLIADSKWSTDLHQRKATANLQLQQWQYAIDEYDLILQREPHNPAALFYRAYANTHLRRYELARHDYESLLQFVPRHMQARLSLAYVLQLMGKQKDALDQLNQTVEMHSDSAVVYATRAALEREMKQTEPALYDWKRASELDGLNAEYVASHVDLLLYMGRKTEALKVLDAAVARGIDRARLNGWYMKCRKRKRMAAGVSINLN
jgi:tetratricopeptide (TPR) repeat protein